jgi:hypothetical protein
VQQLGDIQTHDEGIGLGFFTFPTNKTGAAFGFDMYPDGAPTGSVYNSVQVKFP